MKIIGKQGVVDIAECGICGCTELIGSAMTGGFDIADLTCGECFTFYQRHGVEGLIARALDLK